MKKNSIYWSCFLNNISALICWTILAMYFNKWWLVFFSVLFIYSFGTKHFRICDSCGKHSPEASDYNSAIDLAERNGWKSVIENGERKDYCPECRRKLNY